MKALKIFTLAFLLSSPFISLAQIHVHEVMYDPEGADTKREWIELLNDSGGEVDLTGWKWNDGSNHNLNVPPANGGTGSIKISPGEFAILASDAVTFLSEHVEFSGTVIDTVMSLGQQADNTYTLSILDDAGSTIDTVAYTITQGANGDGNSLQKSGTSWMAALPTPGAANTTTSADTSHDTATTTSNQSDTKKGEGTSSSSSSSSNSSAHSSPAPLSTLDQKMEFEISAGRDRLATVGNTLLFQVAPTRLQNVADPLISYQWSFGDGTTGQGKSVSHAYAFPGEYSVIVNAAASDKQAVSRIEVKVISPDVSITKVAGGIEVWNRSGSEINLENWKLTGDTKEFTFPNDTLIPAKKKVVFADSVTGVTSDTVAISNQLGVEFARTGNLFSQPLQTGVVDTLQIQAQLDEAKHKLAQLTSIRQAPITRAPTTVSSVQASEIKEVDIPEQTQTATVFEAPATTGLVGRIFSWPIRGVNFLKHLFVEE